MNAVEKSKILVLVADSGLPRRKALEYLGLPRSSYYRWLKRQTEGRLQDKKGGSAIPWNKLSPGEVTRILSRARALPELTAAAFIKYNNYRRYHDGLGDATPNDIYSGRH